MASEINPPSALQSVLAKYPDVFMEGLGTLKGVKAKIYVDQGAEPKYIKARSVPYALKTNVELELERLEREGIISPVEFSEWAAPIVPVAKPNGTVRLVIINSQSIKPQYLNHSTSSLDKVQSGVGRLSSRWPSINPRNYFSLQTS